MNIKLGQDFMRLIQIYITILTILKFIVEILRQLNSIILYYVKYFKELII